MSRFPRPPRPRPPTLRWRLTLAFVGVFMTLHLAAMGIAWMVIESGARTALDDRLVALAERVTEMLKYAGASLTDSDLPRFQPLDPQYTILAVRDASGAVEASRFGVDASLLPPVEAGAAVEFHDLAGLPASVAGRAGRPTRLATVRFEMPDGRLRYLDVVETAITPARRFMPIRYFLLASTLGGAVAAFVSGWLLSGRAVSPLERVALAARDVRPEHLTSRFDLDPRSEEVGRLQAELNAALERIEAGYRARERFIANVAHELKTPVAVMLTETQVLAPDSSTPEALDRYRRSLSEELKRLGGTVEGLLALARSNEGEPLARWTDVSLHDVVLESAGRYAEQARRAGVSLVPSLIEGGDPPELRGDLDLLLTLVDNLVRNALRYAPRGSTVAIEVGRDGGALEVTVRDEGPGIPEPLREEVLEPFFRGPRRGAPEGADRGPRHDHLGLGLAIVSSVARMHGGHVTIRSPEGGGCAITVTLPGDPASPPAPAAAPGGAEA